MRDHRRRVGEDFAAGAGVAVIMAEDQVRIGLSNRFLISVLSHLAASVLIGSVTITPSAVTRKTE